MENLSAQKLERHNGDHGNQDEGKHGGEEKKLDDVIGDDFWASKIPCVAVYQRIY